MRSTFRVISLVLATLFLLSGCTRSPALREPGFEKIAREQRAHIPSAAMAVAFEYAQAHAGEIQNKDYVTIIDFDQPSTAKRMHVIDMRTGKVEELLVGHAKKSGENYATMFSNVEGSNMSSLGIYLTGDQIVSPRHGAAMLLHGQEKTNDNALKREIIFHGANYVSEKFIAENGRLGRSLGCPAVSDDVVERLVGELKGGSVLLIYKSATPTTAPAMN